MTASAMQVVSTVLGAAGHGSVRGRGRARRRGMSRYDVTALGARDNHSGSGLDDPRQGAHRVCEPGERAVP